MSDKLSYVEDRILFKMPDSRDYQFAAITIVQAFVAGYDEKMRVNHVLPTQNLKFRLHYSLAMSGHDLQFFRDIGLELATEPEELDGCDMELDFTEDSALSFYAFDRHVCQIYGALCGVQANPAPRIRTVKPALTRNIINVDDDPAHAYKALMEVKDDEISCVIGRQGYMTYWAVSRGLPTIEIIDERTKRAWMSKWFSPVYRMIETTSMDLLPQAITDLEEVTAALRAQEKAA